MFVARGIPRGRSRPRVDGWVDTRALPRVGGLCGGVSVATRTRGRIASYKHNTGHRPKLKMTIA
eukprot:6038525-Pleurochrysis_carterae.AAC.1